MNTLQRELGKLVARLKESGAQDELVAEQEEQAVEGAARRCEVATLRYVRQLPEIMREASFDNFRVLDEATRRSKTLAEKWADDYSRGHRGLLLTGDPGIGKTHLACAAGAHLAAQGYVVNFIDLPITLERISETFGTGDRAPQLLRVAHCDLLIVDDLGIDIGAEWKVEKVHALFQYAHSHWRKMIVTSNLRLDRMAGRLGDRTVSRLVDLCQPLWLNGSDYRKGRSV